MVLVFETFFLFFSKNARNKHFLGWHAWAITLGHVIAVLNSKVVPMRKQHSPHGEKIGSDFETHFGISHLSLIWGDYTVMRGVVTKQKRFKEVPQTVCVCTPYTSNETS